MRRVSLMCTAVATLVLLSPATTRAEVVQDASCTAPDVTSLGSGTNGQHAQTFTALNTGPLTRAEFRIVNTAGTQYWIVQINTVDSSGVPTNTILTATSISDAAVDAAVSEGQVGTIAATFPGPATVVAGQTYALVISRPGTTAWVRGAGDVCPGRYFLRPAPDGTFAGFGSVDLIFRVFVDRPPAGVSSQQLRGTCKGDPVTIPGTEGDDELVGTPDRDVIAGLGGADEIRGLAGKDLICGGAGKDELNGGKGQDKLLGQEGADTLKGGGGNDTCKGGKGRDVEKSC